MVRTFNLILNSQNSTNLNTTGGLGAYSYYINWNAILPSEIKKFDVSYVFRSVQQSTTQATALVLLGVTLGTQLNFDQGASQSNIIDAINPCSYVGTATQYNYISTGDLGFCCTYPTNSNIVVNLLSPATLLPITSVGHYVLMLQFTEVI